jgi:Zn-dependent protease
MTPSEQGSFLLFRIFGIRVYLHFTWFIVAVWVLSERRNLYSSFAWNAAEYLALFGIVLLHEFGHSLACRQTGGRADTIVLWPLGGVAYVAPPPRPGAVLWSTAAGPLVNVFLVPVLFALFYANLSPGQVRLESNVQVFLQAVFEVNLALLFFNLMPVYPLDGGQIFRALLWFFVGPVRSLYIASVTGFVGVAGFGYLAFQWRSIFLGFIAFFLLNYCVRSFQYARLLMRQHS